MAVKRKHPDAKCEECPLFNRRIAPTSFPTKENSYNAAVVSRSPAYGDTISGRPFSGPSGDVLDYLLKLNGVSRKEILTTNVVLCNPPEGEVPLAAIKACAPRLEKELMGVDLVLAAGREACNSLIGSGTIDSRRGYRIERNGRTIVATNNPALVLRDDSTFPNLVKDFARAFHPLPEPKMPNVKLAETVKDALEMVAYIEGHSSTYVGADIESRGGLSHKAELVCIQFSVNANEALVIGEPTVCDSAVIEVLRVLFARSDKTFIWHNGIFDTKILRYGYGIQARVDEDTLLLSYACDERGGVHELEYLLMEEFGWPHYTPGSVMSFKKTGKLVSDKQVTDLEKHYKKELLHGDTTGYDKDYAKLERANYLALYKYAGYDAAGTLQLYELLSNRAKSHSVWDKPYKETLLKAEDTLRSMEMTGMPYDYHRAAEMLEKIVNPELESVRNKLRELTGKELLNPASHDQMAVVYYDDFQVSHIMMQRPDKSRSVDDSARKEIIDGRFKYAGERMPDVNPMIKRNLIQKVAIQHDRFQKLNKQATTYLNSLIERSETDEEQRIYTGLLRHGTTSARLASRGPNLQNVTRTKEGLPDIRGLFYAPVGTLLVQADYSQAELRTIAALSNDRLLSGYYERGEDLHDALAARFYGKDFTYEQRQNSKNMNFGVFYGQSAATFQEKHDIPEKEAEKYIKWVWETFTDVKEWVNETRKLVHTQKFENYSYIQSPFGHRRRFYLITQENRNAVYREAINFLPQNIAANCTLHACIQLHEQIDQRKARLCLTVHDSILAQVQESYVEEYQTICRQVMEAIPHSILKWTIPFKADVGAGKTWATV